MTTAEMNIRLDWESALQEVERTKRGISGAIGWGFYAQDLLVLCTLHRLGRHRETIEDLLEDCNFHKECSLLSDGKYSECEDLILDEYPIF